MDQNRTRASRVGRVRIAILDDYQRVALGCADWASLGADEIVPLHGRIADTPRSW
jgi:hypothetical protein